MSERSHLICWEAFLLSVGAERNGSFRIASTIFFASDFLPLAASFFDLILALRNAADLLSGTALRAVSVNFVASSKRFWCSSEMAVFSNKSTSPLVVAYRWKSNSFYYRSRAPWGCLTFQTISIKELHLSLYSVRVRWWRCFIIHSDPFVPIFGIVKLQSCIFRKLEF